MLLEKREWHNALDCEISADREPDRIRSYVAQVVSEIHAGGFGAGSGRCEDARSNVKCVPQHVFDILTHREFCYLSKTRAEPYRAETIKHIAAAIDRGVPIPFYLDLGGGYHASITPGIEDMVFAPGLGELLVLQQFTRFARRVGEIYAPGVVFTIVIDNLCALFVNEIPVARTERFCALYRDMINALGLSANVRLLVESEQFNPAQYAPIEMVNAPCSRISPNEHGNIERFLGRLCDEAEAIERRNRYSHFGACSESLLATVIDGVHMTQRASPTTLCFRAYPGSDCRIQAGQVALQPSSDGRMKPFLLTSRNAPELTYSELDIASAARGLLATVFCAWPKSLPKQRATVQPIEWDPTDRRTAFPTAPSRIDQGS